MNAAARALGTVGIPILSAAASGQVVNGSFSGSLSPWVVSGTASGGTITSGLASTDIDGPGPLPVSTAGQFMVGQLSPNTGSQGVTVTQPVSLEAGVTYSLVFHWSAWALVNAYNQPAGKFELIVDGQALVHGEAPILAPGQRAYGYVNAPFTPVQTGVFAVGVRITRTALRGEEVFQYIDNFVASPPCYANCDGSTVPPILNVSDYACFLNRFAAGAGYANCDESTLVPVLNVNDFVCFAGRFSAGCP